MVSVRQIVELGLAANTVRARAAAGRFHRVHRGVYAVGRARLDARGRRMAAVLACGPGAALSHRTAADALGLLPYASALIEVSVPVPGGRSRPGMKIHRAPSLRPEHRSDVEGIPCTTPMRTLADLAAVVDARTLTRAIEAAERLRIFDGAKIERANGRLGRALRAYTGEPPPTREEFERRALELFERAGLPRPQVNVWLGEHEVDFCWPDRRLIVEADSWEFHKTRAAFERDRRRDQQLLLDGWITIRITWRAMTERPEEVIAAIAAAA